MARPFMLTLMRHLPTSGNQQKQYIGWTDEAIIPADVSRHQLSWQPEVVYGSDLRRCEESAALYFPQAQYLADRCFRETNFGHWEGQTYDMLKEVKAYRQWIDDPFTYHPPAGESIQQVKKRLLEGLSNLPSGEQQYFIVTHGGPIRILLTTFAPDETDFWSWSIPHGAIWRLTWEDETAFREGKKCRSISAVPITEKPIT